MTDVAFDTHETIEELSDSGFGTRQTEAITVAMRRAISQRGSTKTELTVIETRMTVCLYAGLFAAVVAQTASIIGFFRPSSGPVPGLSA